MDAVKIQGSDHVPESDVKEGLATRASPRFLGIFDGVVYDYSLYDELTLAQDLERVQHYYRSRGYYRAQVRASRVDEKEPQHVHVTISVEENAPVRVGRIEVEGLEDLPPEYQALAENRVRKTLKVGSTFDEQRFEEAEKVLTMALENRGYAWVEVERKAFVNLPADRALLRYSVKPGPVAKYGEVRIKGLGEIPEGPVRRALAFSLDNPYSRQDLQDAEQALFNLGVFTSVSVEPDLDAPQDGKPPHRVPLIVDVQPTTMRTLRLGGGTEVDVIRTDVHALAGWQDRNFMGGLREFDIEFRPGVVFYPTRIPSLRAPTNLLPEQKLSVRLRQPGFFEARTNGIARARLETYPVLLSRQDVDRENVLGYHEARGAFGIERNWKHFYISPTYNLQANFPFSYIGEHDVPKVLVSYLSLLTFLDLRDSSISPRSGLYIGHELQLAGSVLRGDATDIRTQPEARFYIPIRSKSAIAFRGAVGFLFPSNYGETRKFYDENGDINAPTQAVSRDTQLIFLRGFFSGGPTSNRGYPFRAVGPHGSIPFLLSPALENAAGCTADSTEAECALPIGGFSLWEASVEYRFPIGGPLSGVAFCDSSDVSTEAVNVRLNRPHLSCGSGIRYATPVGPIRADIGYRVPGLQTLVDVPARQEGDAGEIFGLPIAIALGIGEAF